MLHINMRFNLAIRLPLQWIAALFYLFKWNLTTFGGVKAAES